MSRLFPVLHSWLPALGQDLVLTAHRRRARRERLGPGFEAELERLLEARRLSPAQVGERRRERLSEVLAHARRTSPWWRHRFEQAGLDLAGHEGIEQLAALPVLDRREARRAGEALRCGPPDGSRPLVAWTSGTSGAPLEVWLSPEALRLQWATWWRHRVEHGVRPGARTLTFGARLPPLGRAARARTWRRDLLSGDAYLSVHELTRERLEPLLDWLATESFELLAGYPSALAVVARALRAADRRLEAPPSLIACGSEQLDPDAETLMRAAFDAPVTDHYGLTEACGNFSRCREGSYHEDPEMGFTELLPVPGLDDARLKQVVFTGLANLAMPLLRYAPGDLAVERAEPCPCGRPGLALERVEGRAEDLLRTPDGRRVGGLNQAMKQARGADGIQIVQTALDRVEARVVAGSEWDEESGERLLQELRDRLGAEVAVELRLVEELPPGPSGKRRAVACELPPDDGPGP